MKIAIDARLYGLEHAGPGRYVLNLVSELTKIDTKNQYEILLRKEYFDKLDFPPKWRKHLVDIRHYSMKEQIEVNKILKKLKPDVVHFPHFNVPIFYKGRFVVTVHDLSKHRSKGKESTTLPYYKYLIKRLAYNRVFDVAVNNSEHILVPSNFVKSDVIQTYNVPPEKVVVTYEGIGINTTKHSEDNLLKKYNITTPFFLFVGSAYPHKNLDRLMEALVFLNQQGSKDVKLVISSSRSVFTQRLEDMIKQKKAGKYVKMLGFVPDDELVALYKKSVGLVYPTLMEGFGLPGLEAMASGTLVFTSDIPVLKEVYKNNAIYFNPYDFSAIAKAMESGLEMKREERRQKIKLSQEFVKRYSWKEMASKTLEVYEKSGTGV